MDSATARTLQQRLQAAGILPTLQRLAVAAVLLPQPVHMTAEQVLAAAREHFGGLSRATVYVVLQVFVRRGLLREVPVEGAATVYDSNTAPHHHFCDVDTGAVLDIPAGRLEVLGLNEVLAGMELAGVDVIVRVRGLARAAGTERSPA